MDGSSPNELLPRKFAQTDAVIKTVGLFKDLHAPTFKKGETKYKKALESYIINTAKKSEIRDRPPNRSFDGNFIDLLKLYDEHDQLLPIVLKVPDIYRYPESIKAIQASHNKHVELLGPEFVEDMTLIEITDPTLLAKLRENADRYKPYGAVQYPEKVFAFVQDLRKQKWDIGLFDYIIQNYQNMNPALRNKIADFLTRLSNSMRNGYVFDLKSTMYTICFPENTRSLSSPKTNLEANESNIIVDEEGPTFIDSGDIGKRSSREIKENPILPPEIDVEVALRLVKGEIGLDQARQELKARYETL